MAVSHIELNAPRPTGGNNLPVAALCIALCRLDRLLDCATQAVQAERGMEGPSPFRGLFVSKDRVARLLSQEPGAGEFRAPQRILAENLNEILPSDSPLLWIKDTFGLSGFDADLILLALAPEIDLRYEKIYAYLQDDITRKRPTVELALNLLCASPEEKLRRRFHFSSSAPLICNGLLQLLADPSQAEPVSLAHYLKLDDSVARLLLGQVSLDARIASFAELIEPAEEWDQLPLDSNLKRALPRLIAEARKGHGPRCFLFQCAARREACQVAEALAKVAGLRLLSAHLDRMPEAARSDPPWKLLSREAHLNGAILHICGIEDLRGQDSGLRREALFAELASRPGITILAGASAWVPHASSEIMPVVFRSPGLAERRACWERKLDELGMNAEARDLDKIAARFRLSSSQIAQAATAARLSLRWQAAQSSPGEDCTEPDSSLSLEDLSAASRGQCGQELAALARKLESRCGWEDLILPSDPKDQLREICLQAEYRAVVFGDWGFDRKLSLGKGLNVLFCGPPGTGKTMAAEVIAGELGLDLYRIDLSQVVSKYIGETEKNLDRIFTAAEQSNAILFFDEADALFGKRSEVRDSHDRYANIEISYLLQKMEEYQGISILATNLRQNLDEAFVRRLQAIVEFPFPDEQYRRLIWDRVFPHEAPLGEDVKFDVFAREVRLAGGNIKNMALAASFLAAADQGVIHLSHLVQAAHREHQKLGRSWNPGALSKVMAAVSGSC